MTATNPTLATAYDNLQASLDRQHAWVTEIIDTVVSAHQHGGKDPFDDRIDALRQEVAGMDTMRQVAGHIGSLPVKVDAVAEPVAGTVATPALAADNQPAQDSGLPVSQAARSGLSDLADDERASQFDERRVAALVAGKNAKPRPVVMKGE